MTRRVATLLSGLAVVLALAGPVEAHDPVAEGGASAADLGLERSGMHSTCRGLFEIHAPNGATGCTHGPDPVPSGVDVHRPPTLAEHWAALLDGGAGAEVQGAADPATIPCVGYGTSGTRVQAIYAYMTGDPSRYAEVAPLIAGWAGEVDAIFDASAAQTGGSRHLRWLHDAACAPLVAEIALSPDAVTDLAQMMSELMAAGYSRPDRRYVVWFDVSEICGVAVNITDDSPGQDNMNNGMPTGFSHFARIDNGCWGVPSPDTLVEAHEVMHTIGAVQYSSPFSSSVDLGGGQWAIYGHCIDEYEIMCYADGSPKPLVERCPASNERYFDCRNDDYFHTAPPGGTYLATHWNTANSAFLVPLDPVGGFLDIDASIFKNDIGWIKGAGITAGCTADGESYCPDSTVTREQMASFLVRALGLPPTGSDFFTDDAGSIHQDDINRVAAAGIAAGCGGGQYCPTETVTRQQMASFLVRAFGLSPTGTDFFTDDQGSIHEPDINRLAASGITGGCGGTNYCPLGAVTRGQMAAFLHRAAT